MAHSALVVLVPEADPVVSGVRARHDPSAQLGVPAHVTLLYPFIPPAKILESVHDSLRGLFGGFDSFPVCFAEVRRWPQEAYLAPQPSAPFAALTRKIASAFPEYPPYEGRHAEIVPHLTIAQGSAAAAERAIREISGLLAERGGIRSICTAATLLENSRGPWQAMQTYPFAAAGPKDCRIDP